MNPFSYDLKDEYELALKSGKQRFGSECDHEATVRGVCVNCKRKVVNSLHRSVFSDPRGKG